MAIRVLALLGMAGGMILGKAAAQARPFGPGEARAVGQALIAAQIARYGRISNPRWDPDISSVLSRLQRAVGYPGLLVEYVVVGNAQQNAAAVPGAAVLVNVGLLRFLQDLAAKATNSPSARHERFIAFLAAVLSHEVAHITLGH